MFRNFMWLECHFELLSCPNERRFTQKDHTHQMENPFSNPSDLGYSNLAGPTEIKERQSDKRHIAVSFVQRLLALRSNRRTIQ